MFTLTQWDFKVPEKLDCPNFTLKKLTIDDAYIDYMVVMTNRDFIIKTRGGHWPSAHHTFEDNLIDVCWFHREFDQKSTFAFGVWNKDKEYIGCVYLYWPGSREETDPEADVDVSFWVTQHAYDEGLYEELYQTLQQWLAEEWPFEHPHWSNSELPGS